MNDKINNPKAIARQLKESLKEILQSSELKELLSYHREFGYWTNERPFDPSHQPENKPYSFLESDFTTRKIQEIQSV